MMDEDYARDWAEDESLACGDARVEEGQTLVLALLDLVDEMRDNQRSVNRRASEALAAAQRAAASG